MSIFGTIMSKIFSGGSAQAASTGGAAPSTAGAHMEASPASSGAATAASSQPSMAGAGVTGTGGNPAGSAAGQVDVGKVLSDMAANNSQTLDWKHSIVDLMKLLGMDSSLSARKALAEELHYTGDTNDSATMNMWLSKQVMAKLAENGGKLPDDLRR